MDLMDVSKKYLPLSLSDCPSISKRRKTYSRKKTIIKIGKRIGGYSIFSFMLRVERWGGEGKGNANP